MKKIAKSDVCTGDDIESSIEVSVVEDALYNVIDGGSSTDPLAILKASRRWIEGLSWTDITKNYPKFESVIVQISNMLEVAPKIRIKVAMLIASIFKWARVVAPTRIFRMEKSEKIFLPPIRRSYRTRPPTKLLVKKGVGETERGAMYISLFGGYPREIFSKLVAHFESMSAADRTAALTKFSKATDEDRKVFVEELKL